MFYLLENVKRSKMELRKKKYLAALFTVNFSYHCQHVLRSKKSKRKCWVNNWLQNRKQCSAVQNIL